MPGGAAERFFAATTAELQGAGSAVEWGALTQPWPDTVRAFRTGDLGAFLSMGARSEADLYLQGRLDMQVNIGGGLFCAMSA